MDQEFSRQCGTIEAEIFGDDVRVDLRDNNNSASSMKEMLTRRSVKKYCRTIFVLSVFFFTVERTARSKMRAAIGKIGEVIAVLFHRCTAQESS